MFPFQDLGVNECKLMKIFVLVGLMDTKNGAFSSFLRIIHLKKKTWMISPLRR